MPGTRDLRPMVQPGRPLGRRAVLLGGFAAAAGVLTGCAAMSAQPSAAPSPSTSPSPSPSPSRTPRPRPLPPLPDVPGYSVFPGEVEPACKQAAVDFLTAVLTTGTVQAAGLPLEARLAAINQPIASAAPLLGLLPPGGASALEVVYPQYGGLSDNRAAASVMLVADHLVRSAGAAPTAIERRSMTVDVRLAVMNGAWIVTEVRPAVLPPAAPALSPTALAVLDNERIVLPAAARADIAGGGVSDAVLSSLNTFSQRWSVGVQVLTAGHPVNIWATNRTSFHTQGRAVDIWALDGVPVIDHSNSAWRDLMYAALDVGAIEVGGPAHLGTGRSFTNATHQDHVHVGFSPLA